MLASRNRFCLILGLVLVGGAVSNAAPPEKQPLVDRSGDPLPAGAVARLGTARLRPGDPNGPFALSPDGKTLLTGEEERLRLWDIETGKETRSIRLPDALRVYRPVFTADGSHAAAIGEKRPRHTGGNAPSWAYVIDLKRGKLLHRLGEESIEFVAFLGDGKLLVTKEGGTSGVIWVEGAPTVVWNRVTGKPLRSWNDVNGLAGSPDGTCLATAHKDGGIRLWDVATWREKRRIAASGETIGPLFFSPDGRLLAGACIRTLAKEDKGSQEREQHSIRLWDIATGRELHRLLGYAKPANHLTFSRDGLTLFSGVGNRPWNVGNPLPLIIENIDADFYESLLIWDVRTGELRRCFADAIPEDDVLSPDSERVYRRRDHRLKELHLATGRVLSGPRLPRWFGDQLAVSSDDRWLVFGGSGLGVWDRKAGRALHTGDGHGREVEYLLFSPDGRMLASADKSGFLRLWEVRGSRDSGSGRLLSRFRPDDSFAISDWAFRNDGSLAAVGEDATLRLWEPESGRLIRTVSLSAEPVFVAGSPRIDPPLANGLRVSCLDDNGRSLFLEGEDGISVWDVATGKRTTRLPGSFPPSTSLKCSPDGQAVVTRGPGDQLALWDLASGKCLARLSGQHRQPWFFDFSPDGSLLAWGWGDTVRLWDRKRNREARQLVLPDKGIYDVAFDPGGRSLLAFVREGSICLWDLPGGQRLSCPPGLRHAPTFWTVHRSPQGRLLVRVPGDHLEEQATIQEALTGRVICDVSGYPPWTISPDGRLVAVGESTVHLVEVATGRVVAQVPAGHRGRVTALAFSPDGRLLATGGSDSTILLWDCDALCGLRLPRGDRGPKELWNDLASREAAVAYRAIGSLVADPAETVRFLGQHLSPVRDKDLASLRRCLRDLEDRRFAVRQRAAQELENAGAEWEYIVREALLSRPSLEVRRRLEAIRESPSLRRFSSETVRALRGLQVLERIGTAEASSLLAKLAAGLPEARLTQEASAALRRLTGK
jgi:WD40 repeat protein